MWATDQPVVGAIALWASLSEALDGSGLVPVLLGGLDGRAERPWDLGEPAPGVTAEVDALDPAEVLGRMWEASVPSSQAELDEMGDLLAPYGLPYPGLGPATPRRSEGRGALARSSAVGKVAGQDRLGLVVARRPADVLAVVGWDGAVNYGEEATAYSAVLRSWEERLGAWLFRVGFDTLQLLVEGPPATPETALPIAAEQFAFCSDAVYQGAGSIEALASAVVGAPLWSFWWD